MFARARLYPDRIELSDWGRHGQENRLIALSDVDHVEWSTTPDSGSIVLVLNEGERIALRLKQAKRWREVLEQRLRWDAQQARRRLDLPLTDLVAYTTSMS